MWKENRQSESKTKKARERHNVTHHTVQPQKREKAAFFYTRSVVVGASKLSEEAFSKSKMNKTEKVTVILNLKP